MNKSKFLKKSLAALLAILMVAAMIPLSAAAATQLNGNDVITVNTTGAVLSGSEFDWDVTLPYGTTTATITVQVKRDCTYVLAGDTVETATDTGSKTAIVEVKDIKADVPQTKVVVCRTIDAETDEATDEVYTFTVVSPAPSHVADVLTATYSVGAQNTPTRPAFTRTGEVDQDTKTITFSVPWGEMPNARIAANLVKITMTAPRTGFNGNVTQTTTDPAYFQNDWNNTNKTNTLTVVAQGGDTTNYTVKFVEDDALTGLSIAGVAAEQDLKTDPTGKTWKVTVPAEDFTTDTAVEADAPKFVKAIGFDTTDGKTTVFENRSTDLSSISWDAAGKATYKLTIKDRDNFTTAAYTVNLHKVQETETGIESVTYQERTATGSPGSYTYTNTYKETGEVSGNALNVTVRSGISDTTHDQVIIKTTSKKVKTVTINNPDGTAATVDDTNKADGKWVLNAPKLGTSVVVVTAEDGKTQYTYALNIEKATAAQSAPKITGAKMTYTDASSKKTEIEGSLNAAGDTYTFTVPAIVTKAAINTELKKSQQADESKAGTGTVVFDWSLTPYTTAGIFKSNIDSQAAEGNGAKGLYVGGSGSDKANKIADYFDGAEGFIQTADTPTFASTTTKVVNTVTATADGGATKTYNLVFKMATANPGHSLTSLTFYGTDRQKKVTDKNTFNTTVRPTGITMNTAMPYNYANPASGGSPTEITAEFVVSPGAHLYLSNGTAITSEVTASGWDKDGNRAFDIGDASELDDVKEFVVISELGLTRTSTAALVPINTAAQGSPSNATAYATLKADAAVTVYPFTYNEVAISSQKDILSLESTNGMVNSVIEGNTVKLIVPTTYVEKDKETYFDLAIKLSDFATLTATNSNFNSKNVMVNAQVKQNTDGTYSLWGTNAVANTWTVTAQDGSVKPYTLTIEVADLDDDNSLSGITVKGEAATKGEDNAWTVELPYGTDLAELTTDDVVATVAEKADYTVAAGEEEGTFTITVKAENGQTADYTLTVTVADEPAPSEFDDVKDTDWFAKVVATATENKWILGANGKFMPNNPMKRGDFALIIARIQVEDFDNNCEEFKTDIYTDVTSESYWNEAIGYVTAEGIMGGRGNGIFDPNGTITREEAAKVMCLAKGLTPAEGNTTFTDDASIAGWAKPYVKACQDNGIVNGSNNAFDPKGKLTRAQGANLLVNAFAE